MIISTESTASPLISPVWRVWGVIVMSENKRCNETWLSGDGPERLGKLVHIQEHYPYQVPSRSAKATRKTVLPAIKGQDQKLNQAAEWGLPQNTLKCLASARRLWTVFWGLLGREAPWVQPWHNEGTFLWRTWASFRPCSRSEWILRLQKRWPEMLGYLHRAAGQRWSQNCCWQGSTLYMCKSPLGCQGSGRFEGHCPLPLVDSNCMSHSFLLYPQSTSVWHYRCCSQMSRNSE